MPYMCQSALDLDDQTLGVIFTGLSQPRMESYLNAVGNQSMKDALVLYAFNQTLSGLFFELLGNIEVLLRNVMHVRLASAYGGPDWFNNVTHILSNERAADIQQALNSIQRSGEPPSSGLVISKLSFGFWVALFEKKYRNEFWIKALHPLFPPGTNLKNLHDDLVEVRDLRNSVAHHERILKFDLRQRLAKAEHIMGLISPQMGSWSEARLSQKIRDCLGEMETFVAASLAGP